MPHLGPLLSFCFLTLSTVPIILATRSIKTLNSPPITFATGATCYYKFIYEMNLKSELIRMPSQAVSSCEDYQRSVTKIDGHFVPIALRHIPSFYSLISSIYTTSNVIETSPRLMAMSSNFCYTVVFRVMKQKVSILHVGMDISLLKDLQSIECPMNKPVGTIDINMYACVAENCTMPATTLRPTPSEAPSKVVAPAMSQPGEEKKCMTLLGDDVVTATKYDTHRFWVIVAGVACNLLSMIFLAFMIHYCLKYRRLRKQCKISTASLLGASTPTPIVRHLGSTTGNPMLQYTAAGGPYPDYQYSSIARRKLKAQQARQYGRHILDDPETMSYRSDHARLLMPGANGIPGHHMRHSSMSGSTLQRHGSGAVSPPRGWGPHESPSTPGSIRRHGSISAVSITSSGYPRRNGTLPPPPQHLKHPQTPDTPPPPPPPPIEPQGTVIY